ncbi:MAG: EAL domain-containing protein [Rubrivivax sp.]
MKARWPAWSIRNTVLASIVIGVVLPALGVLALDGLLSRRAQVPVVQRNRAATNLLAASVLAEPAAARGAPALDAAIAGVLAEPSVCGVEVLELTQATPAARRLDDCTAGRPLQVLDAPLRHEGRTVGRLRLSFDDRDVDQLLAARRAATVGLVALQVLFGVGVLAAVLSLRLLRPISALKRQAGRLAAHEFDADAEIDAHAHAHAAGAYHDDELGELGAHLASVQGQIRGLIGELEAKNAQLERLAMYDHLTGLPNRTLLRELFMHQAAGARRDGAAMALLFVDLDHFKSVNDALGHAAGDALLAEVAQRLRGALRESDHVCRMGGDEFLVLLPRVVGWEQATATAERLAAAVGAPLRLTGSEPQRVGTSIGIALYPQDGGDFDELVRAADVAMYRSKDLGRGRHSLFHTEMDTTLRTRLDLERELADAIAHGELRMVLQPVVDARCQRVLGAEALVRWQHPRRGLLAPGVFIEVAEATGLIQPIGSWMLDAACAQLAAWRAAGREELSIAVNVSALQLHHPGFDAAVQACVQRHGVPPGALTLELTESTLLADGDGVLRAVAALRAAGVKLAIDDFGTGYSSLAAIRLVRPEVLKIDRSFVHDVPDGEDACRYAEALLGLARTLQMEVVAEGVETAAQRDWLLPRGGHHQQGYLWSRPVPPDEFDALLQRERL